MSVTIPQLIHFLRYELRLASDTIPAVVVACQQHPDRLPVVLWQRELVSLAELDAVLHWMVERQQRQAAQTPVADPNLASAR